MDCDALAARGAEPRLILSATDIRTGQIQYFDSDRMELSLDHVLASGSLPPGFPMTRIDGHAYWDGGLFDNTPLGPMIDALAASGDEACIVIINLFPNAGPVPGDMLEVGERMLNLLFANKTKQDLALFERFNAVADMVALLKDNAQAFPETVKANLMAALEKLPYVRMHPPISITPALQADLAAAGDFSPAGIETRERNGVRDADRILSQHGL